MKRIRGWALILSLPVAGVVAGCSRPADSPPRSASTPATPAASGPAALTSAEQASVAALTANKPKGAGAPDFGFMVTPAEYAASYADQPVFRLKTDFPKEKPARLPAFVEQIDFRKNPLEYLVAARDYSFDGNLPDWNPFQNDKAQWYHIPWLHPTTTGPAAYPPNAPRGFTA
jgi:hypothetical protein